VSITTGEILRKEPHPFDIDFKGLDLSEEDYKARGLK